MHVKDSQKIKNKIKNKTGSGIKGGIPRNIGHASNQLIIPS